jgi:hypothetical protein
MPAVGEGQHFGDGIRLAERLGREKNSFVAPIHR